MKRFLLFCLLLLLSVPALPARELKKEWRAYERLARRDRPRDQIAKLHEIRTLALERRLPDDLLDACRQEERVYSRMNWKSADSLQAALLEVVESYGEPMLTFRWLYKDWGYAQAHREELSRGHHPDLQDHKIPFLQTREEDDIADDYEWILWDRLIRAPLAGTDSDEYRLLSEKIGDRYPARPYLSYLMARRAKDRLEAMQALSEQYAGDPFRFLPQKEVLDERLSQLQQDKKATEDAARALYDDAGAFDKAVKAEKGVHQRMSLSAERVRNTLSAKELQVDFRNDSIVLTGRNFGRGSLEFRSDETRRTVSFRNRDGSFFIPDTLIAPVPVLPDGSYTVRAEGLRWPASYEKHTLSLAVRRQGKGYAVYVADYLTGEPVPSATIRFPDQKKRKALEREIALDGFTLLPEDFQKQLSKRFCELEARVGERRSPTIYVSWIGVGASASPERLHARVFKDRGAYRPGDTLKAKAVLFEGDLHEQVKVLPEGQDVQIRIFNAKRKSLADINLKTNAFGSVAWEWPIPFGERNGLWNIELVYRKKVLESADFRVDDFVLPTFELVFDPQQDPFFPDTDFTLGGRVINYSGHPVDGIRLEGSVSRYRQEQWKGPVSIDLDGSFRIPLHLKDSGEYQLTIRAVDATGETHSFDHSFSVTDYISLDVALGNALAGDFSLRSARLENALLAEPVGRFVWTVKNGRENVRMPVSYKLLDADGHALLEGTEEELLELDLSDYPDGLYFLQGIVEAGKRRDRIDLPFVKMVSAPDAPVRSIFLPGQTEIEAGESIRARLGAGNGPLWAVASLFAPDGRVLASRSVYLDGIRGGKGSLSDLSFHYEDNYPDAVRLEVFYFRDAQQITQKAVYHRVRHEMDLPLTFSRFEDRTIPGTPCTLSLQTRPGVELAVAVFDKSLDAMQPNEWRAVSPLPPVFRNAGTRSRAGHITGSLPGIAVVGGSGLVFGIVLDSDGLPVIGASVLVEGSTQGVVTDLDGRFSLDVPVGTLLIVSCIGYQSARVAASSGMQVVLEIESEMLEETVVIGYGAAPALGGRGSGLDTRRRQRSASASGIFGARAPEEPILWIEEEEEEEVALLSNIPDENYRAVFSEALAFEPFLYPDEAGKVDLSFRTSDKVSTYHVNVFAHDRSLRNAALRRDFVVTVPVQLSVTPPRYLYEGDEYTLSAAVSSISDEPVSGRLYLQAGTGSERQPMQVAEMTVPAGGTASARFDVPAPAAEGQPLDLRLVFEGGNFSDAVRFSLPLYRTAQSLTERHSALAGMEAVDSLRRMFVNVPGEQAEVTVKTLREVVEAGLSEWTVPEDPDALSRSADYYARLLLGRDTTGTLAPLLALRCEDGGFAWMEGMDSSPVVTATLLERFATLRDLGYSIPDMEASVHYLDISQFGNLFPRWCGGLADDQYMDIRAMWASVPFDLKAVEKKAVRHFRLREFRRFARAYLTPGRYDYANGWVLDKARRVRTLRNLTASEEGIALGQAWGEQVFTAARFENAISNDLISLEQYAVRHPSGGLYYPNAILPFRGLLSSEVYAHVLISKLLGGKVADGVKLWLILQNETQSWTGDPAYVDALQSVLAAPDSLLDRKIVSLSASAEVPFEDIKASGNGMRVEQKYYREKDGDRAEVQPGDTLRVGDRLITCYELWSAENRSFVRLDAFREAGLLPVEQRSGLMGGDDKKLGIVAYRIDGLWTRLPKLYRDIRVDRTVWWFDVCPEETIRWEESCFVVQAGTFTAPVITVESFYAPVYRANGAYRGPLKTSDGY